MTPEITQDSIFPSEKKVIETIEKDNSNSIPIGYIPVYFSSKDKFGPPVLHFRNYTMEELLHISSMTNETVLDDLIHKVLNVMVYEDFDCSTLPAANITQILLSIYANFWGDTLYNMEFYIDENDPEKGTDKVDIKLNKLKGIEIDDKFKAPFTISDPITNYKVKLNITRINHIFFANKFIKELYKEKEESFEEIKNKLNLIETLKNSKDELQQKQAQNIVISEKDKEEYEDFQTEKSKMYVRVLQSQLIHSINGVELKTIEEKLEAFRTKIDATVWKEYSNIVKQYPFGIDPNYSFKYNNKTITRRFSFRLLDFIPTMDQKSDRRYTVSFDD